MREDARATFSTKAAMEMYVKIYRWIIYILIGRGKRGNFLEKLGYSSFNVIFLVSVGKSDIDFHH